MRQIFWHNEESWLFLNKIQNVNNYTKNIHLKTFLKFTESLILHIKDRIIISLRLISLMIKCAPIIANGKVSFRILAKPLYSILWIRKFLNSYVMKNNWWGNLYWYYGGDKQNNNYYNNHIRITWCLLLLHSSRVIVSALDNIGIKEAFFCSAFMISTLAWGQKEMVQ